MVRLYVSFIIVKIFVLVTVGFMIQPVWSTATPARNGFVMAVETHPAGKIQ